MEAIQNLPILLPVIILAVVLLIALLVLSSRQKRKDKSEASVCPHCHQRVETSAIECSYCYRKIVFD